MNKKRSVWMFGLVLACTPLVFGADLPGVNEILEDAEGKVAGIATVAAERASLNSARVSVLPMPPTQMPEDGLNEAAGVCGSLSFDNKKAACMRVVSSAQFFDTAAARVCGGRSFDDGKIACLSAAADKNFQPDAVGVCASISFDNRIAGCINAVANKGFLPAEISACASASFDDGKVSCFQNAGRPLVARPPYEPRPNIDGYILSQLKSIQSDLQRGNLPRALLHLAALVNFVQEGMK